MSTELTTLKNVGKGKELKVTQYYGGKDVGTMLQLTQGIGNMFGEDEPGFIQLKSSDIDEVVNVLTSWKKSLEDTEGERCPHCDVDLYIESWEGWIWKCPMCDHVSRVATSKEISDAEDAGLF